MRNVDFIPLLGGGLDLTERVTLAAECWEPSEGTTELAQGRWRDPGTKAGVGSSGEILAQVHLRE